MQRARLLVALFLSIEFFSLYAEQVKQPKIVGLVRARNEQIMMPTFLRALSKLVDAIVVLDDASTDETLKILVDMCEDYKVETIIRKRNWVHNDGQDRNAVLNMGRKIGGTHFVIIDVDEMFTANCLENDFLRKEILALSPGEQLNFHWVRLWGSPYKYRSVKEYKACIFCDDGYSKYHPSFLHPPRIPNHNTPGHIKVKVKTLDPEKYGLLHFQAANRRNMAVRQAWYKCLEHIQDPNRSIDWINRFYGHCEKEDVDLIDTPIEWYAGYDFLTMGILTARETNREDQIMDWFDEYGKDYFKDLAIWHIDWAHSK